MKRQRTLPTSAWTILWGMGQSTGVYLGTLPTPVHAWVPPLTRPPIRPKPPSVRAVLVDAQHTSQPSPVPNDVRHSLRTCVSLVELQRRYDELLDNLPVRSRPRWTAAALKRTVQLLAVDPNNNNNNNQHTTRTGHPFLSTLLKTVDTAVVSSAELTGNNGRPNPCFSTNLSLYTLCDVLTSLSILAIRTECGYGNTHVHEFHNRLQTLAQKIWNHLAERSDIVLRQAGPKRWVDCLRSVHSLQLDLATHPTSNNNNNNKDASTKYPCFYQSLCHRLTRGDALAQLSARDLTAVLQALAASRLDHAAERNLLRAVARRLRKKSVRVNASDATLARAAAAAVLLASRNVDDDIATTDVHELQTLVYTVTKDLVAHAKESNEARAVSELVATLVSLSAFAVPADDPLVRDAYQWLTQRALQSPETWTVTDLARFAEASVSWNLPATNELAQVLATHFGSLVAVATPNFPCQPSHVNDILRCAVLLHGRDDSIMKMYRTTARTLFLDEKFLGKCEMRELSNYAWFMSAAKWNDDQVWEALGNEILRLEHTEECSPKTACRVLRSFTNQASYAESAPQQVSRRSEMLFCLFRNLGEPLLSTQISTRDVTSAIYTYAKALYVDDMGIFDHLVEVMVARLDNCSNRQVAQSLWACGKMMAWEGELEIDDHPEPPYLSNSWALASFLSSHAEELSTKDVAQALWAMAYLGIRDASIVSPIASRAHTLSAELTSQEVANIVWALCKLQSQDYKVIFVLTRRFGLDSKLQPTPQEAANVLYALGRMNIRDEEVFRNLSSGMIRQINMASSQALTNAMWAHRAVHIVPPRLLLDSWATQRLGLVGVQSHFKDDDLSDYTVEYDLI